MIKILLAPSYDLAKNIKADATVETEYGDFLVDGEIISLAHHGKRSNNPAPCNKITTHDFYKAIKILEKELLLNKQQKTQ